MIQPSTAIAPLGAAEEARLAAFPREAAVVGDAELFRVVAESLRRIVGRNDPDFDDLMQSAFEKVWKSLPTFEGRSSLSTWVFRVCYRSVLTDRRGVRRFLARFHFGRDYETDVDSDDLNSHERVQEKARAKRLHAALSRMKPSHATVLTMVDLEGMTLEEVAELLEMPKMTVRSRLRTAREDLSSRLRKDRFFGEAACTNQGVSKKVGDP